ncbi:hypothetical protein RFI_21353 [Reticulomyxa filosa]|uniref:Uncharacterized protein n=1 Tax=Reticulomyxa filosa TaxID=46433 RepID=X6MPT5_RETFI|nr:hypothetical protein RFI_21353 [Reticulomyxa filosa]|eukprot:ETO16008.1 hypothetical protein RFI_21353 [Reticulomyxa filosa]
MFMLEQINYNLFPENSDDNQNKIHIRWHPPLKTQKNIMTENLPQTETKEAVVATKPNVETVTEKRESHSFGNVPQYQISSNPDNTPYHVEEPLVGSSQVKTKDVATPYGDGPGYCGPRSFRIVSISTAILCYIFFSIAYWFDTQEWEKVDKRLNTSFAPAYKLKGSGSILILFGCLFSFAVQATRCVKIVTESRVVNIIIALILTLGGVIYLIGGFVIAENIGKLGTHYKNVYFFFYVNEDDSQSAQAIQIADGFFIMGLSLVLGVDVWRNYLSLSIRFRSIALVNTLMVFSALLYFFAFATFGDDVANSRTKATAAGFWFILVGGLLLVVFEFVDIYCARLGEIRLYALKSRLQLLTFVSITIYLFGAFLADCGLWAIVGAGNLDTKENAAVIGMTFLLSFSKKTDSTTCLCFDFVFSLVLFDFIFFAFFPPASCLKKYHIKIYFACKKVVVLMPCSGQHVQFNKDLKK